MYCMKGKLIMKKILACAIIVVAQYLILGMNILPQHINIAIDKEQ